VGLTLSEGQDCGAAGGSLTQPKKVEKGGAARREGVREVGKDLEG